MRARDNLSNRLDVIAGVRSNRCERFARRRSRAEQKTMSLDVRFGEPALRALKRFFVTERKAKQVLISVLAARSGIEVRGNQAIASNETAEVATAVFGGLFDGSREGAGPDEPVSLRDVGAPRASCARPSFDELPTPVGEKSMIASGDDLRAVFQ
ncbi:MAG TPA: hypothetical protein VFV10_00565 [Gammaproteobacteria bacterium]|nr:hypothetical protein [Gammaproteobacteria bacterium]